MENKFKNYTAEKFMKLCFADDSGQYKNENKYRFWENFAKMNIKVWDTNCPKIYNYANSYNALPDPDVNSYNLYEAHIKVWNKQCEEFKNKKIKNIERHGRCRCQIIIKDEKKTKDDKIILGSDSIMSIYWHRTYGNMPDVMKNICEDDEKLQDAINKLKQLLNLKEEDIRFYNDMRKDKNYSRYKEFIWYYLHYANTIGGFTLFPRHDCSINQARGMSDKIQDRFDLTLECIRRMYESGFSMISNPLFDISTEDKEFFNMFGKGKEGFENYAKFFCLNESYDGKQNWVKDGHVLNLMNNEELDTYDFSKEPLPNAEQWWTFYDNIMNRLNARNEQIRKLIQQEGD